MKKKVLSIAVIAVSLFAFSANAQNTENCPRKQCPAEKCAPNGPRSHQGQRLDAFCNPFEGIELTEAQKTKLEEMRKSNHEAMKQKMAEGRKKHEEACAKRDSIIRSGKLNHLRQLKEVLTPEQYVTYLENMVVNQPAPRKPMGFGKGKPGKPCDFKKGGCDDHRGHKHHKGNKNKDVKKEEAK